MGNLQCHDTSEADDDIFLSVGGSSSRHNHKSHPHGVPDSAAAETCRRQMDHAKCQEAAARQHLQEARIRVIAAQARVEAQQTRVTQAQQRKVHADAKWNRVCSKQQQQPQSQNGAGSSSSWWTEHLRKAQLDAHSALEKETKLLEQEQQEWEDAKAPIPELSEELDRRREHVKEMVAAGQAFSQQLSRHSTSKFMRDSLITEFVSHLDSITEHYTTIPIPTEISCLDTSEETLSEMGDEEADLALVGNSPSSRNTTISNDSSSDSSPALSHPPEKQQVLISPTGSRLSV